MTKKDETLDRACLLAVSGSKAYGLDNPLSDTDQLGVFVAPTTDVAGLSWHSNKETWTNASPNGDDLTLHEIGKYLRLCLKGNPTLLELLFMENYVILDEVGKGIVNLRDDILSEPAVRSSYYGYASSQYKNLVKADEVKEKIARHTLRIARQGTELLKTGTVSVRLADPKEYFDLTKLPKEDMLSVIHKELEELRNCDSVLHEEPNVMTVVKFLSTVRRQNM